MSSAQIEKRKTRRRPVLETFSLFVVIPKKGGYRLKVHDVSEGGMYFDLDEAGESENVTPLSEGDTFETQLYLNQSLYLPLQTKVARIESAGNVRRVGVEFTQKNSASYQAYRSFVQMLDSILEEARLQS